MSISQNEFKKFALIAAQKADDKIASDILVLDLRKESGGASDYVVLMSGNSDSHLNALKDTIEDALEEKGLRLIHREGLNTGHWVAMDFGGFIVHIFHENVRKFYALDRLWEKARVIPWESEKEVKKAVSQKKTIKKKVVKKKIVMKKVAKKNVVKKKASKKKTVKKKAVKKKK